MRVPPENRDPVLRRHPTRRRVGYFGAVRLRDGKFVDSEGNSIRSGPAGKSTGAWPAVGTSPAARGNVYAGYNVQAAGTRPAPALTVRSAENPVSNTGPT